MTNEYKRLTGWHHNDGYEFWGDANFNLFIDEWIIILDVYITLILYMIQYVLDDFVV